MIRQQEGEKKEETGEMDSVNLFLEDENSGERKKGLIVRVVEWVAYYFQHHFLMNH